jgi:hypothetical protein
LEEVEGEVLAFDQSTRMLILKGCTYRLLSTLDQLYFNFNILGIVETVFCLSGTRTVIKYGSGYDYGSGTVIKWNHKNSQTQYKIVYLISFI